MHLESSRWNRVSQIRSTIQFAANILVVRDYHGSYYVPHNLTLIVAGKLASGTGTLLDVVQERVEPSIISHGQDLGTRPKDWRRPFLETPSSNRPTFTQTVKDTVEFPEKDESVGEVQISWLGPSPTDFLENKVCGINE